MSIVFLYEMKTSSIAEVLRNVVHKSLRPYIENDNDEPVSFKRILFCY